MKMVKLALSPRGVRPHELPDTFYIEKERIRQFLANIGIRVGA